MAAAALHPTHCAPRTPSLSLSLSRLVSLSLFRCQLIPDDYEYSSNNGDAFQSVDASIKEGTEVRIRIVGVRADPSDMVSCWARAGRVQRFAACMPARHNACCGVQLLCVQAVCLSTCLWCVHARAAFRRASLNLRSRIAVCAPATWRCHPRTPLPLLAYTRQFCIGTMKDEYLGVISSEGV